MCKREFIWQRFFRELIQLRRSECCWCLSRVNSAAAGESSLAVISPTDLLFLAAVLLSSLLGNMVGRVGGVGVGVLGGMYDCVI